MNSYTLSRQWFAFAFENPSKVKPIHGSIYFWLIELANRLGWPAEFGNPGSQCMAACGIASYNTYKKAFDELVDFGFIKVNRKSKNQYQSCVIALSIIDKAPYKALDKALEMHSIKHLQSTCKSTDSIIKPLNQELLNLKHLNKSILFFLNQKHFGFKIFTIPKKQKKATHTRGAGPKQEIDFGNGEFNIPEFRLKWEEFKQHRKKIKAPITTLDSEQRIFNKATSYDAKFIIEQIDATIDSGKWQSFIFQDTPQKYATWQAKNNPSKKLTATRNDDDAYRVERFVA